jgi:anaerobic magnesium-protoporphyrin IX monomethyl ester cyclase
MRILLVYPDYSPASFVTKVEKLGYYSEGIAALAAALTADGHEIRGFHPVSPDEVAGFPEVMAKTKPDVVALSARTTVFPDVTKMAGAAKDAGVPTIVGGVHPTIVPEEVAPAPDFDYTCVGEGDVPLVELCRAIEDDRNARGIPGIWTRRGETLVKNPAPPPVENLDGLPFPDYNVFDPERLYGFSMGDAAASLSRGCPYACTYCCNHKIKETYPKGSKYTRFRSPGNAIAYLKNLVAHFPETRRIEFFDDILPLKKTWFAEFMGLYRKDINLPFACSARVDLIDPDVVELLAGAGCYLIHFGVESGNEELRSTVLNRRITNAQTKTAFAMCREAGIATLSYNMVGLPREDKAKFLETVKLNAEIRPYRTVLAVFFPYPHTAAYNLAEKEGILPDKITPGSGEYLNQPGFTPAQVKFCLTYFRAFIKWYSFLARAGALGAVAARLTDTLFVNPYLPHGALAAIGRSIRRVFHRTRGFLLDAAPGLYETLRTRAHMRHLDKAHMRHLDKTHMRHLDKAHVRHPGKEHTRHPGKKRTGVTPDSTEPDD